jgi:microcystin-dependent protein
MKIQLDIDLKTPRWARIAAFVLIPGAMVIATTAVVHATVPNTFSAGATLSSAQLNANFSSLDGRVTTLESAGGGVPSGTIVAFGGVTAPAGWVLCDGTQYNGLATQYSGLYAAIGTAFGGSASSQAFNVPDLRGRFLRGWNHGTSADPDAATRTALNAGGQTGDNVGSLQLGATALPVAGFATDTAGGHTHAAGMVGDNAIVSGNLQVQPIGNTVHIGASGFGEGNTAEAGDHSHTVSGGDHETRPLNVAVNYIIKL